MADVLVVDDIVDAADSVAELLTLFGHDVRVAYSAAQALDEMDLHMPDVLLSDISMPVVDGFELARRIRQRWGTGIRLVAHSGSPRASVAASLKQAGFDSFVSKSARPLDLGLAVAGRQGAFGLRTAQRDRRGSHRSSPASRRHRRA
ncbi:MAG TPA: response regulator [Casimicrobiaceae bacterium]|nr:response regulator [Casimicrobiaceae bacterium]